MIRAVLALASVLALGACAIIAPPPPAPPGVADPEDWRQRQARLAGFDNWSLQGRVATGKLLGWSGNLNWKQNGEHFDVRVSGPVGAGGFRALGTLERVEIRTEDERIYTNRPEALVEELLGWRFPLTGLRYWVVGLPAPDAPAKLSVDDEGLLVGLEQAGWQLGYTEYQDTAGPRLPRRIVLDNGENRIKLVIDRWFGLN